MDNQEFSDADLGLTLPVKPENKNVVTPDLVAPAVKRRDWNNLSDDDLFAPAKPSLFKPESLFQDVNPLLTSGLSHGEAIILTTDGAHKRLAYWDKNQMSFQTKKPIMGYLKPASTPDGIGDLPGAIDSHKVRAAKKDYENLVKQLDEKKAAYAQHEADMAKAPGSQRYVGNYGVDLRDSIKELEEQVRASKDERIDPENVLGIQRGQGSIAAFSQNLARSAAHTIGTLPGFTIAAAPGAKMGMKVPGPPIVKAVSAAIGGAITGTMGGMVTGAAEQALENWIIPVSEQERINTMTSPTAATAGQTASLAVPFNLQKISTFGKAVGIGAQSTAARNAARMQIGKSALGMVPIGAAGRGASAIQAELSGKSYDADGNQIENKGFSAGNVAKEVFSPSGFAHDLVTGAFIRNANKVGRAFEFHKAGAWLASKTVPGGKVSPEQKAMFDEAVKAQAEAEAKAKAEEAANPGQQAQPGPDKTASGSKAPVAGSVEPMPEFPPETASDAERGAWLNAAQAWHEKYAGTHEYDGTPKAAQPQAAQPQAAQPQAQAQATTEAPKVTIKSKFQKALAGILDGSIDSTHLLGVKRFEGTDKNGKTFEQRIREAIKAFNKDYGNFVLSEDHYREHETKNPGLMEALIVDPVTRRVTQEGVDKLVDESTYDPDLIEFYPESSTRRIKLGMKLGKNVRGELEWLSPTPRSDIERAADPSIFEMQVKRPEAAPSEPAPRKLTPQEQEAADLADFDPNSVNPEIPRAPKRMGYNGDETIPGYKPEFDIPGHKGGAEGVQPITKQPSLPKDFFEGLDPLVWQETHGYTNLVRSMSNDPKVPEAIRNQIKQKIDADKVGFDLIHQAQQEWSKNRQAANLETQKQPGKQNVEFGTDGIPVDKSGHWFALENRKQIAEAQAAWDAKYGKEFHGTGEMYATKAGDIKRAAIEAAKKKHLEAKALEREAAAERAKNETAAQKQADLKAKKEAEKQAKQQPVAEKPKPEAPSNDKDLEDRLSPEDIAWINEPRDGHQLKVFAEGSKAVLAVIRRPFTSNEGMSLEKTKALLERTEADKDDPDIRDLRKMHELRVKYHSGETQGAKPKKPVKPEPVEPTNSDDPYTWNEKDVNGLAGTGGGKWINNDNSGLIRKSGNFFEVFRVHENNALQKVGSAKTLEDAKAWFWDRQQADERVPKPVKPKGKDKSVETEEDVVPKESDAKLVARRDSLIEDAREFRELEDDASYKEFMDKAKEINDRIKDPKKKIVFETEKDLNEKEDTMASENEIETPEPSKDEDIRNDAIDGARKAIKEWEVQREKLKKLNDLKPSDKTERQINNLTRKIKENEAAVTGLVAGERARRARLDPLKDKINVLAANKGKAKAKEDIAKLYELDDKPIERASILEYSKILGQSMSDFYDATKSSITPQAKKALEQIIDVVNFVHDAHAWKTSSKKRNTGVPIDNAMQAVIKQAAKAYERIVTGGHPETAADLIKDYVKNLKKIYTGTSVQVEAGLKFFGKWPEDKTPDKSKDKSEAEEVALERNEDEMPQIERDILDKINEAHKKGRSEFQAMRHGDWEMFRSKHIEAIKTATKLIKQLQKRWVGSDARNEKIENAVRIVEKSFEEILKTGVLDPKDKSSKLEQIVKGTRFTNIYHDLVDAIDNFNALDGLSGRKIDVDKRIDQVNKDFAKANGKPAPTAQPDKQENPAIPDSAPEAKEKDATPVSSEQFKAMEKLFKQRLDAFDITSEYRKKDSPIRQFIDLVDQLWTENKQYPSPESLAGYNLYNSLSQGRLVSPEFFKDALEAFKGVRLRMHIKGAADLKRVIEDAMSRSERDAKLPETIKKYQDLRDSALKDLEKARKDKNKAKINDANDRLMSAQNSLSRILETAAKRGIDTTKLIQGEGVARTDVEAPKVKPKKEVDQPKDSNDPVEKTIKIILALEAFTNEAQNYEVVQRRESQGTDGKWYSNGNFPAGVKDSKKIPRNSGWVLRHKVSMTTHGVVHAIKEQAVEALANYQKKQSSDFEKALREMNDEKLQSQLKFWMKEGEKHGKNNNKQKEFAELIETLSAEFDKEVEAPKAPEARKEPEDSIQERQKDLEAKKKKAEDDAIADSAKSSKDTRVEPTDGITYVRDGDQEIPIAVTIDKSQKSLKGVQKVVKAGVDLDGTDPYQEIMPKGAKYFTNGKLIYIEAESALDRTPLRKNQQRKVEDVEQANKMGDGVIKIDGKRWIDVTLPDQPQSLTFELLENAGKKGDSDGVIRISTAWSTARNGVNAQAFYAPDLLRQLIKNMDKDTSLRLIYTDYGKKNDGTPNQVVMAVAVKNGKIVGLAMPLNPTVGSMGTLYNPRAVKARRGGAEEPEAELMASEDAMRAAEQGREQPKSAQGDLFKVEGENYQRKVKPGVLIGEDGLPIRPGASIRGTGELAGLQGYGKDYAEGGYPSWYDVGHNETEYTVGKKFRNVEPESVVDVYGSPPDTGFEPGDVFSPREDMFVLGIDGKLRKTQADKYTPDHEEWLHSEGDPDAAPRADYDKDNWVPRKYGWYGRVNHPVYDTQGNVVIRGAISVTLNPATVVKGNASREAGVELQTKDGRVKIRAKMPAETAQTLKEQIAREMASDPDSTDSPSKSLHLDRPEHYDVFVFDESVSARRERGISSEDGSPSELAGSGHQNREKRPELDKLYDTESTPETEKSTLERIDKSLDKPMDIANAVDMVLQDLPETSRSTLLRSLSRVAKSRGLQISFLSTKSEGAYGMGKNTDGSYRTGLGAYMQRGQTIRVFMPDVKAEVAARGYKMMDTIVYVMSHEIAHHHTLQLITENAKITGVGGNSIGFRDRVKALMDYVVTHNLSDLRVINPEGRLEYGLTKEAEFMAEVVSNPRFRDLLNQIPAPPDRNVKTGKQSVLDQIFIAIKYAFKKIGINIDRGTVFDRSTELYAEALATENAPMSTDQSIAREGALGFEPLYRWSPEGKPAATPEQMSLELEANKSDIAKLNSKNPDEVQRGLDGIVGDAELMPPSGGGGGGNQPSPGSGSAPRAGKTKRQKVFDFVTLRALSGISVKAHQNARRYPQSSALKAVANFIHARPGPNSRAFQRDIPTSIQMARQKFQNQFVDIMSPIRSMLDGFKDAPNGGPTAAEQRELVYRTIHDMATGTIPVSTGKLGEVATKIGGLMKTLHDYRTLAGEKIGEIADYFPAKYDSDRIAQSEQAFVNDAAKAYEMTISEIDAGPFYDNAKLKKKAAEFKAEAQAEKAKMMGISVADMLKMTKAQLDTAIRAKSRSLADVLFRTHQRGMSQEEFSSIFGSDTVMNGSESSSMKRVFTGKAQRVMQKWQHADPFRVVTSYIASATKRAEMVRKFGDDGKIWENYSSKMERDGVPRQVIREMRRLMRKAAGIGTPPRAEGDQVYVDSLSLITASAALGKSALNNLVEPVAMGGRSNSLRRMAEGYVKTWALSARNILRISETIDKKLMPTFWEAYGHHIGTIHKSIDDAWTMGHTTDPELDNTGSKLRWLTNRVYKANLMDATEVAKQTASLSIAKNYLRDLAALTKKQHWMNKIGMDPAQSTADNLSELGIQPGLQKKFADWMVSLDGLSKQQLMDKITKGDQMSRLFEEAMIRFSKQSSVTSNRAHKPEFQDSSGGATVLNLMNFSYSFAAEVNSRVYDNIKQSVSAAPKGKTYNASDRAMMLMAPVISGAFAVAAYYLLFELKQRVFPTDQSGAMLGKNPWAKALNALSYAGYLGPKFEYAMKFVQRDQLPGGPTVKMASNIGRAAASAASIPFSDKSPGAVQKSLVKAALPVVRGGLVTGASAANPMLGAAMVQATNITQPQNALLESFDTKKKNGIGDLLESAPPGYKKLDGGGMEAKQPGKKK